MKGIIQLRGLIQTMAERNTIVVIVSHDVDLINSVATDVIHFHDQILTYYRGNYVDFQIQKQQHDLHKIRQQHTLDKQRKSMIKTIDNLKSKSSSGNSKKISKQMNNRRKKLEKHGIEKDEHGHRRTVQKAMTGIKIGSINTLDASTRKQGSKNYAQLLKDASLNVAPIPGMFSLKIDQTKNLKYYSIVFLLCLMLTKIINDVNALVDKEVQFSFRTTNCQWYEPLISASGVGHGFEVVQDANTNTSNTNNDEAVTTIFDDIDLCMDEKSITCILGEGGSGKSTLLKILAGEIQPRKGKVKYAHNINIAYFDQHKADNLIVEGMTKHGSKTSSISLLMALYPKKSEQDIRGILTSFGLSPQQASTYIQYLSGGERCRLCLAMLMLSDPHVLILDEPSNHLDPESVDALHHGIRHWNGTVVLVSHDVHLIRQLEDVKCYVLVKEGKLKYVMGGIDSYLKAVSMQESKKIESESE
jgi:ATPase subunit of ABC transporter with duplicated ATPase domains